MELKKTKLEKEIKNMQYAIIIYEGPAQFAERNNPEKAPAYWGAWTAYAKAIAEAGIMRGGAGLQPPEISTVLSLKDGKRLVQDGPYAETKEQLGGFFVIEVSSLDEALEWAAKSPAMAKGKIEVRPVLAPPSN